jgi:hypothetical protein
MKKQALLLHAELVCVCPVVRRLSLYALIAAGRRRRADPFRWSLMRDWSGAHAAEGPGSRRVASLSRLILIVIGALVACNAECTVASAAGRRILYS